MGRSSQKTEGEQKKWVSRCCNQLVPIFHLSTKPPATLRPRQPGQPFGKGKNKDQGVARRMSRGSLCIRLISFAAD